MEPIESDHSVLREWWEGLTATFSGLNQFWKQRSRILQDPHCAVDPTAKLAHKPLRFALNMIIVPAVLVSASGSVLRYLPQLPPLPLEREVAVLKRAKEAVTEAGQDGKGMKMPDVFDDDFDTKLAALMKQNEKQDNVLKDIARDLPFEIQLPLAFAPVGAMDPTAKTQSQVAAIMTAMAALKAQQRYASLMTPIYRAIVPVSLVATALMFRLFLSTYRADYPKARRADRAYLYFVAARLFFPNAIGLTGIYVIEFASRFTRWHETDVSALSGLLVIVCGIWGLAALMDSGAALRKILGFDTGVAAAKKNLVRNRLLLASIVTGVTTSALLSVIGQVALNVFF